MPSNWSVDILHETSGHALDQYIIKLTAIDVGSGEIPSLVLTLDAKNGQFLTTNSGEFGTVPIIKQFDVLSLLIVPDNTNLSNNYAKRYFIDKIVPPFNMQEGNRVELHCLGFERYLQMIHFARQYYFADAFSVMKDIADRYNHSKGSLQPSIINQNDSSFNQLPNWTANFYDFQVSEKTCYDGMLEIIDKLGAPASSGGAGNFFELWFDDDISTDNIRLNAFISGSHDTGVIISPQTVQALNIGETEGGIESAQGTLIAAWGADDQGSLPTGLAKFRGIDEAFQLYPTWQPSQNYPKDATVNYNGTVYRSNGDFNNNTPPSGWTLLHEYDLLGPTFYSEWTDGKANHWKNGGGDPTGANYGRSFYDSNLVVQDGGYYRTMADVRVSNPSNIPITKLMFNGSTYVPYGGLKVLADNNLGAMGGAFSQNGGRDRHGNPYVNAVVQHNGGINGNYLDWDVSIIPSTNFSCAVIDEAKVYVYGGTHWNDYTSQISPLGPQPGFKINDCFHPYFALTNDANTRVKIAKSGGGTYGDTAAINVTYKFTPILPNFLNTAIPSDHNYYQIGCWLSMAFPFPLSTDNGVTGGTGYVYGGINHNPPAPNAIDANNMHLTHSGGTGFNENDSEDLGPLSALAFQIKLKLLDGFGISTFEANYNIRCALYDTSDNVVTQDFVIPFDDMWADIVLPLHGFQIYRARIPLKWGDIQGIIPVKGLDILNVFQWKNIKRITWQLQDVYDDQGRYRPEDSRINRAVFGSILGGQSSLSMWIDVLRFVKPLFSTSGRVLDRNLEPTFLQRPNITNKSQLDNEVISYKQIYQFQHKTMEITTMGNTDIAFGDTFYYRDPNIINDGDNGLNTIKLVAKKITYKIDKTATGPGGLVRTIYGAKRFQS